MQIVIDIREEDYEIMKRNVVVGNPLCPIGQEEMVNKVVNGTLLPKGHGDLIDRSNLITITDISADAKEFTYVSYSEIEDAPTIIEADKESD